MKCKECGLELPKPRNFWFAANYKDGSGGVYRIMAVCYEQALRILKSEVSLVEFIQVGEPETGEPFNFSGDLAIEVFGWTSIKE